MITIKEETQLIERIKSLPEIEFSSLFKQIAEHVGRNKWDHLIDGCFDGSESNGKIEDLETQIDKLERDVSDVEEERDQLQKKLDKIQDLL